MPVDYGERLFLYPLVAEHRLGMANNMIHSLPTRLNVEAAWNEFQRLNRLFDEDARCRADLAFCQSLARAYRRWQELFLAMDVAA